MSAAQPSGPPSGIRKLGTASLRADSLLDAYARRSEYPSRSEASGAFKRAAPFLGHDARAVTLVDYLISLTQAQDWEGGAITVWPSNARLCHVFGAVERTIQVQLAGLHEAGLIAFLDSPSRRRYGLRDESGRIAEAYGIDLRPLAARYEEFCGVAEEAEADFQERKALRRLVSIARQKTEQVCDAAIALEPGDPSPWLERAARAESLGLAALETPANERIRALLAELEELHRTCLQAFRELAPVSADADEEDRDSRYPESQPSPLTSTKPPALRAKQCGASKDSRRPPEDDLQPIRPPDLSAERPSHPENGRTGRPAAPPERVHSHLRTYRISPSMLAEASPPLAQALWTLNAEEKAGWRDVVDGAGSLLPQLGISQHAWGEACHEISREGAAVAVAIIAAKHERGSIRSPGGYLRWITREIASGGVLDLGPKLWGLREADLPSRPDRTGQSERAIPPSP